MKRAIIFLFAQIITTQNGALFKGDVTLVGLGAL